MICPICECEFTPKNPKRPSVTCSRSCANKMVWATIPKRRCGPLPQPRVIAACAYCGRPVKWAQRPGRQGKYCSRQCAGRAKATGGIYKGKDGRWRIVLRNGSKELYSRGVIAGQLGRDLEYDEIVHHVNGNCSDDRLENLQLMSRSEHTSMHSKMWWSLLRAQGRS